MLHATWLSVCQRNGSRRAILDVASGRSWSFDDLAAAASAMPALSGPVRWIRATSIPLIIEVLASWRDHHPACPLEPGQSAPELGSSLPAGCVHLKCTSGSTGAPRLIAFSASQLAADANAIVAAMGLNPTVPNVAVISMAHSYGFSNLVLPLLLHGIPIILPASPLPDAIRAVSAATDDSAVALPAVPALWHAWHAARCIPRKVRIALSAGAPLPLGLEHAIFEGHGLKIHNFYGASECGGIAYDATETPRTDPAQIGTPLPGVQLSTTTDGLLVVHSPAVALGYLPDSAGSSLPGDGHFHSSDLAECNGGRWRLLGRASDVMNLAGRKASPEPIEAALRTVPGVVECLVLGVPSAETGRSEEILAIIRGDPQLATQGRLRDAVLERLPAWQVPRRWWFREDLLASTRGKLSRATWRHRWQREKGSPSRNPT